MSMKRTRAWLGVVFVLVLLSLTPACKKGGEVGNRGGGGETSKWRSPLPTQTFKFETVTLDAKGQVVDPRKSEGKFYSEDLGGGVKLMMVEVPAGTFKMGSSESDTQTVVNNIRRTNPTFQADAFNSETPQHEVSVPQFYMGMTEVTQAQWRAVAGMPKVKIDLEPDPSNFKGDGLPVEKVSWDQATEFCARLSKATGRTYRLPSEAEWEYAARAGTQTPFAFGETITTDLVNYDGTFSYGDGPKGFSRLKTEDLALMRVANGFGLYHMHGNVWEWCEDLYDVDYTKTPRDGSAWLPEGAEYRIARGGSWIDAAYYCRSAYRRMNEPNRRDEYLGFRVVSPALSN